MPITCPHSVVKFFEMGKARLPAVRVVHEGQSMSTASLTQPITADNIKRFVSSFIDSQARSNVRCNHCIAISEVL